MRAALSNRILSFIGGAFAAIEFQDESWEQILLMEFCVLDVAEIFYTSLSVDFTIEFSRNKNLQ